ncbi:MAG: ExbD/TolR family protein [Vicinamibacterales bacterium]
MPKVQPTSNGGHGRSGRGHRVTSSLAEINVVPLVDVMLVLLIIFMVAAPMIQRGVEVNLPVASRSARIEGERVIISVPSSYAKDRIVYLGEEALPADVLQERVRQRMETASTREVYLRGDGTLTYQEVLGIMDMLKGAGVDRVGLETGLPPRPAR